MGVFDLWGGQLIVVKYYTRNKLGLRTFPMVSQMVALSANLGGPQILGRNLIPYFPY